MGNKFCQSIERAKFLLGMNSDHEDYLLIKIEPVKKSCCCFHCWPTTWKTVNEHIKPNGPLEDEGDVLVNTGEGNYILECHESGPEIIVKIALITASLTLANSIVNLIVTLIKSLSNEKIKSLGKIKISKKKILLGEIKEEKIIEIDIPLSEETSRKLESHISRCLLQKVENDKRQQEQVQPG